MVKGTKKGKIILMLALLLGLSGCGRKDVDYSAATEGQDKTTSGVEEQADIGEDIPGHVECSINTLYGDVIEINADVKLPSAYNKCTVMELSCETFEAADIEYYVDLLFDKGTDVLYMPYTAEEMAEIKQNFEALKQTATSDREIMAFEDAMLEPEYYPEIPEEDFEGFEEYRLYNLGDEERCQILGKIHDEYYLLTFFKSTKNYVMILNRWGYGNDLYLVEVSEDNYYMQTEGNTCAYSQEEAEALALDFVKNLGYDNFGVIKTHNAYNRHYTKAGEEVNEVDGYNIYLGRAYDNYSYIYSSNICLNDEQDDICVFDAFDSGWTDAVSEYIRVYVDSQGICRINFFNPMKEERILAENVKLLAFDKVLDTFGKPYEFTELGNSAVVGEIEISDSSNYETCTYYIDEIVLGYGYVGEGNTRALVPVWYFFEREDTSGMSTGQSKFVYKRINALDGGYVDENMKYIEYVNTDMQE